MSNGLRIGVSSLEGDNLPVFSYLCTSEIWPDNKRGWPLVGEASKEGDYCTSLIIFGLIQMGFEDTIYCTQGEYAY